MYSYLRKNRGRGGERFMYTSQKRISEFCSFAVSLYNILRILTALIRTNKLTAAYLIIIIIIIIIIEMSHGLLIRAPNYQPGGSWAS